MIYNLKSILILILIKEKNFKNNFKISYFVLKKIYLYF